MCRGAGWLAVCVCVCVCVHGSVGFKKRNIFKTHLYHILGMESKQDSEK